MTTAIAAMPRPVAAPTRGIQIANFIVFQAAWFGAVLFDKAGRQSPPAYVERVVAGSPAATVGLRVDDMRSALLP